jgi:hypothetical protein
MSREFVHLANGHKGILREIAKTISPFFPARFSIFLKHENCII